MAKCLRLRPCLYLIGAFFVVQLALTVLWIEDRLDHGEGTGKLSRMHLLRPHHRAGVASNHNNYRALQHHNLQENQLEQAPDADSQVKNKKLPRVLAIYFPQYHRDPLNDKNWGENFTDWVSLRNSPDKNIQSYRIPRPADGDYYNLNDVKPRQRQGDLAKQFGIDGFIYHHYWFYDRSHPGPNLAQPLLNMLKDGHPNVPFLLNWCALRWVNVWMGRAIFQTIPTNKNRAIILQEQYLDNVTDEEIRQHYNWLSPFFHHPLYITVDNQPVFFTYNYDARALPILRKLREYAKQDGFDGLYLLVGRSAMPNYIYQPPPDLTMVLKEQLMRTMQTLELLGMDDKQYNASSVYNQSMTYPYPLEYIATTFSVPQWCLKSGGGDSSFFAPPRPSRRARRPEIPGVITTFDNSPRRPDKEARIYNQGTREEVLERFRRNLFVAMYYQTCCLQPNAKSEDRFVTINSWNEWAEGMAMEPSDVYGTGFLEIIRDVKAQVQATTCNDPQGVHSDLQGATSTEEDDPFETSDEKRARMIIETGWADKRKAVDAKYRRRGQQRRGRQMMQGQRRQA